MVAAAPLALRRGSEGCGRRCGFEIDGGTPWPDRRNRSGWSTSSTRRKSAAGVVDEPLLEQADPAVEVELRIVGADVHHMAEIVERPVEVALLGADRAPLDVGRV